MKGYKTEILTPKKSENRIDSFWYRDNEIAKVDFPNGNKLYIDTCGEIRIQFEIDGQVFRNHKAVERAEELNLNDDNLNTMANEFDAFGNNNWFAIREFDINGELIGDDLGIASDYDEALTLLETVAEEKMKEYYS
jgi:hypothetical protein